LGNIPKPQKQKFDQDSPIYRKGDPNQAGEGGKAFKIEKEVIIINFFVFNAILFRNYHRKRGKNMMKDSKRMHSINMPAIKYQYIGLNK
jgi:hypothetical protein